MINSIWQEKYEPTKMTKNSRKYHDNSKPQHECLNSTRLLPQSYKTVQKWSSISNNSLHFTIYKYRCTICCSLKLLLLLLLARQFISTTIYIAPWVMKVKVNGALTGDTCVRIVKQASLQINLHDVTFTGNEFLRSGFPHEADRSLSVAVFAGGGTSSCMWLVERRLDISH